MENKLKNLTEKLYNDGIEKGKKEADSLINNAKKEADQILKNAKTSAEKIVNDAKADADNMKKKIQSELGLSTKQVITKLKTEISNMVTLENVASGSKQAFADKEFIQTLILKVVEGWSKDSSFDMKVTLPKELQKDLEGFLKQKCGQQLSKGLEINFSDEVKKGFVVTPKDSSFRIEFSDDSFQNFFNQYLKPLTRDILFEKV